MIRSGVLMFWETAETWDDAPAVDEMFETFECLASAYLDGVRKILLAATLTGPGLVDAIGRFNRILASRNLEEMRLRRAKPGSGAARNMGELFEEANRVQARRFLRPIETEAPEASDGPTHLAQIQGINPGGEGALYAATPVIDPLACSGCDACLRICPTDVLMQIKDTGDQAAYSVAPASCDGCALCEGVCATLAIRLEYMAMAPADVLLTSWGCDACGVHVHAPAAQPREDSLCDICRTTGHHKKLFQVLS